MSTTRNEVTFIFLAVASLAWSVLLIRWSVSRQHSPWRRRLLVCSAATAAIAAISIASDFRSLLLRLRAPDDGVAVVITDMGGWWQLAYTRGHTGFISANELHVPAGSLVTLDWRGGPFASWSSHDFLPGPIGRSFFIAKDRGVDDVLLFRLWPLPMHRRLRIVADSRASFDRWFVNEMRPSAASASSSLFTSAGCSYCHVIRGVAEQPWKPAAPDLTHFAARGTIAATGTPNRHGFLAGWVIDSRGIKRDSEMPPNALEPAVLHPLLAYLESLH